MTQSARPGNGVIIWRRNCNNNYQQFWWTFRARSDKKIPKGKSPIGLTITSLNIMIQPQTPLITPEDYADVEELSNLVQARALELTKGNREAASIIAASLKQQLIWAIHNSRCQLN